MMIDIVDEEESEGNVSPQSPYNTRSSQQARRRDDSQVILPFGLLVHTSLAFEWQ